MNEKNINLSITKYKLFKLLAYMSVLIVGIIALTINTPIASCLAVVFIIAWSNIVPGKFFPFIFNKYIESSLLYALDSLDGELYLQIVKRSKINAPDATYRLCGEYHAGNYQAVLDICTQCLADEKLAAFKYYYYIYLANCYFDMGNDEMLKEVCEKFTASVEKEAAKERIFKNFPAIIFFNHYLNGEFNKCLEVVNEHSDNKRTVVTRKFRKARILTQTGEKDEAKALFESVKSDAPKFNLSILASHGIEAIEKGIEYRETFDNITPSKEELPELARIKRNARTGKVLTIAVVICFVAVFIFSFFNYANSLDSSETAKAVEEIRVLAEENYDGVEVVDVFNLRKDGEIIDSMFLCKTDTKYIIGSIFNYADDESKTKHISVGAEFDISFDTTDTIFEIVPTINEYYLAEVVFCKNAADIPAENQHSSIINVNDKDVYFVVTDALENPLYYFFNGAN